LINIIIADFFYKACYEMSSNVQYYPKKQVTFRRRSAEVMVWWHCKSQYCNIMMM